MVWCSCYLAISHSFACFHDKLMITWLKIPKFFVLIKFACTGNNDVTDSANYIFAHDRENNPSRIQHVIQYLLVLPRKSSFSSTSMTTVLLRSDQLHYISYFPYPNKPLVVLYIHGVKIFADERDSVLVSWQALSNTWYFSNM